MSQHLLDGVPYQACRYLIGARPEELNSGLTPTSVII